MQENTYYMIALWGILALITSYLFYRKPKSSFPKLLFFLRFVSLWTLLLLLFLPEIQSSKTYTVKPVLNILTDNTASMKHTGGDGQAMDFLKKIEQNPDLNAHFDIRYYTFGTDISEGKSLAFDRNGSDIAGALTNLTQIDRSQYSALLLLSDGRATSGQDYTYAQNLHPVFAVACGDTTRYRDIRIEKVQSNTYSFAGNRFPVEIQLAYTGDDAVNSTLRISEKGKVLYKKDLKLSPEKKTATLKLHLDAAEPGVHYYKVQLQKISNEKNIRNNFKSFRVEVVDEHSDLLLVAGVFHPDIASLKRAIQRNKQRKLKVVSPEKFPHDLSGYSEIILYQPDESFSPILKSLQNQKINSFIITGTHTSWKALNALQSAFQKETGSQTEEYKARANEHFDAFVYKDPGLSGLPPLTDYFGKIKFHTEHQILLYQNVAGIDTDQPLLALYSRTDGSKHAVLFGEGIWRWRMQYMHRYGQADEYDAFWMALLRYLEPGARRTQYDLKYKKELYKNENQSISVRFQDKNYRAYKNLTPVLHLSGPGGNKEKIPMIKSMGYYTSVLPGQSPGTYRFYIDAGSKFPRPGGAYTVEDYSVEQQFYTADIQHLKELAHYTKGGFYLPDRAQNLFDELIKSSRFKKIIKEKKIKQKLIDWKYLLALLILSLSIEWFIRKYRGMI